MLPFVPKVTGRNIEVIVSGTFGDSVGKVADFRADRMGGFKGKEVT
jgi:hypothetical protein